MSEKRNDPVLETLNPADRARFLNMVKTVSYTHLTLPTTPYV